MRVFIVGLGLMGASYALGLSNKGYHVDGYDLNNEIINQAIHENVIKTGDLKALKQADLIILALYPKDNVAFLKNHLHMLNKQQIITDLSGTKLWMIDQIERILPKDIHYISHHPMAGRETAGYAYKNTEMFSNANFLLVPTSHTHETDIAVLKQLASILNFGRVTIMSPQEHDELIGFTSQLTHLLAVSLVNSDTMPHTKDATGDSYRDLTRIAKINETMWSELFLENKGPLLNNIDLFLNELYKIKKMIEVDDFTALKKYLKQAKEKRKTFD